MGSKSHIRTRTRWLTLGVSVSFVALAAPAPPVARYAFAAAPGTTVEELIKEGLELRRAGRDSDALPKFEAAYNQSKSPRAAAQWGLCLQAVSRWSEADPMLAEALSATHDAWVKKNRDVLKESQEAVKAHVGRVEVLGGPVGASVTVAGRVVGSLPLPSAVMVNEGSVDVEVSASGYKLAVRTLSVSGASYQRVVLRLEPVAVGSPSPLEPSSTTDQSVKDDSLNIATPATPEESRPITKNPWLWVGAGAAVLGVIATVVILSSGTEYPKVNAERIIQ